MTKEEYYQTLREAGHLLILENEGEVNIFVMDYESHNGPGCRLCDMSWCHHCQPKPEPCKNSQICVKCSGPSNGPQPCPYQSDVHEYTELFCNCCEKCSHECCRDI